MNKEELLWRLGQRIKKLREDKGITQQQIAHELDTEKSNISRLESGRVNPKFSTLINVAKQLGIKITELVDIDNTETNE